MSIITSSRRLSGQELLLVIFTLLLFVMAFLPTLMVDYVPMDQWRAFMYAQADDGGLPRLQGCVARSLPFFLATGRPLVWQGECIEHALVGQIRDFRRLRPLCLLIVLATIVAIAYALRDLFEAPSLAVITAALLLYSPGYCFMYYQGLTGSEVLLSAILGTLSFGVIARVNFTSLGDFLHYRKSVALSFLFFIVACFIYPAYALVAAAFALIYAAFDQTQSFLNRARRFAVVVIYYAIATVIYLGVSDVLTRIYFQSTHKSIEEYIAPNSGYNFVISFGHGQLFNKIATLWTYFFSRLSVASFDTVPSAVKFIMAAGVILVAATEIGANGSRPLSIRRVILATGGFIGGLLVLAAPWLVSGFLEIGDRQILGWEAFTACSLVLLASRLLSLNRLGLTPRAQIYLVFALLFVPATVRQLKASIDQVFQSNMEIRYLRAALRKLVASGDIYRVHHIHVIRPVGALDYAGQPHREGEENLIATAANPVHIYEMTKAVLREVMPADRLRKLQIADCRFDQQCVGQAIFMGAVALTQGYGSDPAPNDSESAVIDFRLAELGPVQGTKLLNENGPVSASAFPHSGCCDPYFAFDSDNRTFFESDAGFPVRVVVHIPGMCHASNVYTLASNLYPQRMPRAWRVFSRSTSADNWILLDEQQSVAPWKEFEIRPFRLRSDVCANEFKFEFLSAGDPRLLRIGEIGFRALGDTTVTASSVLAPFLPDGLLEAEEPGWHAAPNAGFPQWVSFAFTEPKHIGSVGLLPQVQKWSRAPKQIVVETSDNGFTWSPAGKIANACPSSDSAWAYYPLTTAITTQYLRLMILSNCGDPTLLSLRGVKLAP